MGTNEQIETIRSRLLPPYDELDLLAREYLEKYWEESQQDRLEKLRQQRFEKIRKILFEGIGPLHDEVGAVPYPWGEDQPNRRPTQEEWDKMLAGLREVLPDVQMTYYGGEEDDEWMLVIKMPLGFDITFFQDTPVIALGETEMMGNWSEIPLEAAVVLLNGL